MIADNTSGILETRLINIVVSTTQHFIDNSEIVWRTAMAFSIIARIQIEIANNIANTEIQELLVRNYDSFDDCRVKQQILWMIGSLLEYHKLRRKMLRSTSIMKLSESLLLSRDDMVKKMTFSVRVSLFHSCLAIVW